MATKNFWDALTIPSQVEADGFEFVNPVVMAQQFVKAVGYAQMIGKELEDLTSEIVKLTIQKERIERDLRRLRVDILSHSYDKVTKSASAEIQDAFVRRQAIVLGRVTELDKLEAALEDLVKKIEDREPERDRRKNQLKILELAMNWGKQYLDFDKLLRRTSA